jgi:hypothetical protein
MYILVGYVVVYLSQGLRPRCADRVAAGADFRDKSLSLALAIVIDASRSSFLGIGFDQVFENLVNSVVSVPSFVFGQ